MTLRLLEYKDREKVATLLDFYWQNRGINGRSDYWAKVYLDEGHKREIGNEEFFIYENDGIIIGFISLITNVQDIAQIRDEIMVAKDENNKNFEIIINEIIKIALLRKIRKLFSLSIPKYVSEYEKLGFVKEGVLKDHYVKGEDLTIMSMFL